VRLLLAGHRRNQPSEKQLQVGTGAVDPDLHGPRIEFGQLDPNSHWKCGSGSRKAKMAHKKRNNVKKCFGLKWWMFSFEGCRILLWLGRPPWSGDLRINTVGAISLEASISILRKAGRKLNTITICRSATYLNISLSQFHSYRILIHESKINAEWRSMWILIRNR
jgi:hypothetical protein